MDTTTATADAVVAAPEKPLIPASARGRDAEHTVVLSDRVIRQNRWARLGGFSGSSILPPERLTAFVFGFPGVGKSRFMLDNPNAFVMNLDMAPTPGGLSYNPQAVYYPAIQYDQDRITDENGQPLEITWPIFSRKIELLLEMARANEPRPATIVFDSLTAWVRLMRQWMPGVAHLLGISTEPRASWNALNGQAAWEFLYSSIVHTIYQLRTAGYGVWIVGHIVNARVPTGEDAFTIMPELTITGGFWKRLYDLFDLSICVKSEEVTEVVSENVERVVQGRKVNLVHRRNVTTVKHFLTLNVGDELRGICKSRVPLPTVIPLPEQGGWESFATAYRQAVAGIGSISSSPDSSKE